MGLTSKEQPLLITNTLDYASDSKGINYNSYVTTDWDRRTNQTHIEVLHSSQLLVLLDEVLPNKIARISSAITDWSGYYQWNITETDPIQSLLMRKYNQLRDLYVVAWKEYYYLRPSGLVNLRRDIIYSSATAVNRAPYHPSGLWPHDVGLPGTETWLSWNGCYPNRGGDPDDYSPYNFKEYVVYCSNRNPPDYLNTVTVPSAQAKSLESLTTYYWRVVATDNSNASSPSYITSFMTGP